MKLRHVSLALLAIICVAAVACGGATESTGDPSAGEPTGTATAAVVPNIWQSPIIAAIYGTNAQVTTTELAYGPPTGFCGYTYISGHGFSNSIDDTDGSQSTGFVSVVDANLKWSITARTTHPGDQIFAFVQCIPWSDFSKGAPTRSGYDGVVDYDNVNAALENGENPWTAVFVPMSFWGEFSDPWQTKIVNNHSIISGFSEQAGVELCTGANNTSTLCGDAFSGYANGVPYVDSTAVQFYGYSWSPATCSYTLGRHSNGNCIYVPNGENANVTPTSPCDLCYAQNFSQFGGTTSTSCQADNNTTDCPGAANRFCFLSQIWGPFDSNVGGTVAIANQGSNSSPPQLNAFGASGAPGPSAAMTCIETVF